MPRAKTDCSQDYVGVMSCIANLKSYSTDLIPDFQKIYSMQLKRFRGMFYEDELHKLESKIAALSKIKVSVQNESRVYIVTQLDVVLFAANNLDSAVLDNLQFEFDILEPDHPEWVNPNYINTLFILEKSKLVYQRDISTLKAIQLTIAFQKENLLNAGNVRDNWYGKPRRDAKRLSKSLG